MRASRTTKTTATRFNQNNQHDGGRYNSDKETAGTANLSIFGSTAMKSRPAFTTSTRYQAQSSLAVCLIILASADGTDKFTNAKSAVLRMKEHAV